MEILTPVEQLKHDAFHGCRWDGVPSWLCVVVNDLEEIVFGILKYHEDALVFEDDFDEPDHVYVAQF